MLLFEILFFIGLGWHGIREPLKKKWRRDLTVFVILFLLSFFILIMRSAGVQLPYLLDSVEAFFKSALRLSVD